MLKNDERLFPSFFFFQPSENKKTFAYFEEIGEEEELTRGESGSAYS